MWRQGTIIALILVCAAPALAGAPAPGQLSVNLGGGMNMPTNEDMDSGYVVVAGAGFHLSKSLVLGAELSYMGYGAEEASIEMRNETVTTRLQQHFFGTLASARYYLPGVKRQFYFKGLAGRFTYGVSRTVDGTEDLTYDYADIQVGGGGGLILRGREEGNLYLEALANNLRGEGSSEMIFTFTMGMDFNFRP